MINVTQRRALLHDIQHECERLEHERRKEIARTWAACNVPVEDITRLLGISETELETILNEPAKAEQ